MVEEDYEDYEAESPAIPQIQDNVDKILDLDTVINRIITFLSGEVVLPDGRRIRLHKPVIPEYGIGRVAKILQAYMHKGIILSDLSDSQISTMLEHLHKELVNDIFINREKYGLKDPQTASMLVEEIMDNIWATVMRARYGETARGLREVIRTVVERVIERKERRGLFGIGGR